MFLRLIFCVVFFLLSCADTERDSINDPGSANYIANASSDSNPGNSSSSSVGSSSSSGSSSSGTQFNPNITYGTLHYEEQNYKTVQIGNQVWLAENLNYNVTGSKCYNNEDSNCTTYGRLYDWATAMDLATTCNNTSGCTIESKHKGICPTGWHIPSNAEWDQLYRFADKTTDTESPYSSPTAGTKLKSSTLLNAYSDVPAGTNEYGFSALPGGGHHFDGSFFSVSGSGYWWSSSEGNSNSTAYRRYMYYNDEYAGYHDYNKKYLFSVRCLQNDD